MSAKINFKNNKEFRKKLLKDVPSAYRFAAANALSELAYSGVIKAEREIKKSMNLRSKHIVGNKPGSRAVKYNRAKPRRNLNLIYSEFGATKDYSYLKDQEKGFRHNDTVPAKAARTSKNYNKRIRKINYFNRMKIKQISSKYNGKTPLKKTRAMLYLSYKKKFGKIGSNQFFYFENKQFHNFKSGFFQFVGGTSKYYQYPRLKKIYHGKNTTKTKRPAKKWLQKSINKFTQKEVDQKFEKNAKQQLKRFKLI